MSPGVILTFPFTKGSLRTNELLSRAEHGSDEPKANRSPEATQKLRSQADFTAIMPSLHTGELTVRFLKTVVSPDGELTFLLCRCNGQLSSTFSSLFQAGVTALHLLEVGS
jgi:hypothetical protein